MFKLKKSLHGLKQSGHNWNNMLHKLLVDQDVNQSIADPCLYTSCEGDDIIMMLVLVDDIIIAASNDNVLSTV